MLCFPINEVLIILNAWSMNEHCGLLRCRAMVNGITLDQTSRVACVSCRNAFTMVDNLTCLSCKFSVILNKTNLFLLSDTVNWPIIREGCKPNRIWSWIFHLQLIRETSWNQGAGIWIPGVLFYMHVPVLYVVLLTFIFAVPLVGIYHSFDRVLLCNYISSWN